MIIRNTFDLDIRPICTPNGSDVVPRDWWRISMESIVPTFILERDGLFRDGLRLILSRTRFRPQSCGIELDDLTAIPTDGPIVFIVGIAEKRDFVRRVKRIRDQYPLSLILAIGDESHRKYMACALDAGASAALCASVTASALITSLDAMMSGVLIVIDAQLWRYDIKPKIEERASLPLAPEIENEPPEVKQLSAREIAILERIVRGDSNKHVARFFEIAEPTVKAHAKAIFRKMGVSNRTQAAIWALNHGLFKHLSSIAHDISEPHSGSAEGGDHILSQVRSTIPSSRDILCEDAPGTQSDGAWPLLSKGTTRARIDRRRTNAV
jgi:two-component system nitrate/nitrite response regulator NarL